MLAQTIKLPAPKTLSWNLADAIRQRRSVRDFQAKNLTQEEIATLLWSCQGLTGSGNLRAAPSAGATYPLEVYVVTADGLFHYRPASHELAQEQKEDLRQPLARAGLGQEAIAAAPAVFVLTGVVARTARRYGDRAERYVFMEMGHAAQNLHLAAVAMDLGSVPIGAFYDEEVARLLRLDRGQIPGYLIPVGTPRE